MINLIEKLEMFNAKERFFLVGQVLGNPLFQPSEKFMEELCGKLGLKTPETKTVFAAMDYHLEWLFAALQLFSSNNEKDCYPNDSNLVKGNQEDVDFLLAWREGDDFHIVLVEAKGVTSWTNKQIESKALRLNNIWGENGNKIEHVIPHFVLISPKESVGLNEDVCPEWMCPKGQFVWMKLQAPANHGTHKVCRCKPDKKIEKGGGCWGVFKRRSRA